MNPSPDQLLPLLKKTEIPFDDGGFKCNPFLHHGDRLRIVGYDAVNDLHCIKNETTREFKWKTGAWLGWVTGSGERLEFNRQKRGHTLGTVKAPNGK